MYRHDFHRITFGQDPIVSHPLSTNYPEEEPKPITGGADLRHRPKVATEEKQQPSSIEIANKVAQKIKARGAAGVLGLSSSFRVMDSDNLGYLSFEEMSKAMRDYRITNDARDVKSIFEIFDTDRSGGISYNEFLRVIVGEMNEFRR
jgi:hypothetical protein